MGAGLLAFLGVALLVIATPGQDTAITIRNTLVGGRRAGLFTALGVSAGQAVWTFAASAGVAALIVASEPAFLALRIAGAAYLVFLGAQALVAALRGSRPHPGGTAGRPRGLGSRAALRQGLLSNLGNPKMAVFFTSLLPQFVPSDGPAFPVLLALGLTFCTLTLLWLAGYAFAVARARNVLARPRARRALDAVTGAALVAFGARLAASER